MSEFSQEPFWGEWSEDTAEKAREVIDEGRR
jgi:hypothetical protein